MSTPFSSRNVTIENPLSRQAQNIANLLRDVRQINITAKPHEGNESVSVNEEHGFLRQLKSLASTLDSHGHPLEANALLEVHELGITSTQFGGLGLPQDDNQHLSEQDAAELLFLVSGQLEALNSADRAREPVAPLSLRPSGRRGMTLSEKIFAAHDVDRKGEVKPGDMIRVDVDWIIASEFSWRGMERWYDRLGKPGIYRNDRFWLAGDHLVDPRIYEHPKIKPYIESAERAKRQFKMTENQGMNYTIMHTEFCRERAQPGMLVIGSDSHTCSAGSVSCLAIGLGVADVLLPLVTGETWFKVPDTVEIRFINKPKPGISGKDVILYVLKELKRNTVAAERVVEYTGPGVEYLSCDARFAIANMTTEFGGVTGIFVPDIITQDFINKRKKPKYRSHSTYFRPDPDAQYIETHIIDLAQVQSFVARYPKPDDVVPVGELAGLELQGCFIGACTTAEEDLVLAALVLEEAMRRGATPARTGIRKMVPGSLPILHKLRRTGLADIYLQAGWEIGVPSCSYCVGASADKAAKGETWLTSQNRNFENRMGAGSFGNLASAVTVAASSFDMKVTDPGPLLDAIDIQRLHDYLNPGVQLDSPSKVEYVEPGARATASHESREPNQSGADKVTPLDSELHRQVDPLSEPGEPARSAEGESPPLSSTIRGKVQLLGDFIDTDALAPAEGATQASVTKEILGSFCLFHTHPDFRQRVKDGHSIVVAGEAFGCGSSREDAVFALQGAGVQCVIAKSFAFIYARTQPNLGLLGFEMKNPRFWELVGDGREIAVDLDQTLVHLNVDGQGTWESFPFQLGTMQRRLLDCGGAEKAFGRYGKNLWSKLAAPSSPDKGTDLSGKKSSFPQLEQGADKGKTDW